VEKETLSFVLVATYGAKNFIILSEGLTKNKGSERRYEVHFLSCFILFDYYLHSYLIAGRLSGL